MIYEVKKTNEILELCQFPSRHLPPKNSGVAHLSLQDVERSLVMVDFVHDFLILELSALDQLLMQTGDTEYDSAWASGKPFWFGSQYLGQAEIWEQPLRRAMKRCARSVALLSVLGSDTGASREASPHNADVPFDNARYGKMN